MSEMIDNVNITKQMRDINIGDLLGRQQITFDDVGVARSQHYISGVDNLIEFVVFANDRRHSFYFNEAYYLVQK